MYIYDATEQAEDQRMSFFTFLGDHSSSDVRSRDRFVRHQRDTSALHGFSRLVVSLDPKVARFVSFASSAFIMSRSIFKGLQNVVFACNGGITFRYSFNFTWDLRMNCFSFVASLSIQVQVPHSLHSSHSSKATPTGKWHHPQA
jgi:hypothetical protein